MSWKVVGGPSVPSASYDSVDAWQADAEAVAGHPLAVHQAMSYRDGKPAAEVICLGARPVLEWTDSTWPVRGSVP